MSRFCFAVAFAVSVVLACVQSNGDQDVYDINPKFVRKFPSVQEVPKFEKPSLDIPQQPEIPKYETPDHPLPSLPSLPDVPDYSKSQPDQTSAPDDFDYKVPQSAAPSDFSNDYPTMKSSPVSDNPEYPRFNSQSRPDFSGSNSQPDYNQNDFYQKYVAPYLPETLKRYYGQVASESDSMKQETLDSDSNYPTFQYSASDEVQPTAKREAIPADNSTQESRRYPDSRVFLPFDNGFFNYEPIYRPAPVDNDYRSDYVPEYQDGASHDYHKSVEGDGSYYRLDTCEYRFILDMVQCHQEERHTGNVKVHESGQDSYHGQGNRYNPSYGYGGFPYDNRYNDFVRLYGHPSRYSGKLHSFRPGSFDNTLFTYHPSVGHPFYAPGLHNTPFAKYYAGFRAGQVDGKQETEKRAYHKDGHYHSALRDFNNLQLQNVIKVEAEAEASEKTSTQVSASQAEEQAYTGATPYFNYNVHLMPNHCSLHGVPGKHTCIVFEGSTHPYKKVQRQFIYVKKSREVKGKYRFRYENDQKQKEYY